MLLTSTQIDSLLLLRDAISLELAQEKSCHPDASLDDYQCAIDALELRRLSSMIDADKLCHDIGKAGHTYYVRASIILDKR